MHFFLVYLHTKCLYIHKASSSRCCTVCLYWVINHWGSLSSNFIVEIWITPAERFSQNSHSLLNFCLYNRISFFVSTAILNNSSLDKLALWHIGRFDLSVGWLPTSPRLSVIVLFSEMTGCDRNPALTARYSCSPTGVAVSSDSFTRCCCRLEDLLWLARRSRVLYALGPSEISPGIDSGRG